MDSGALGRRAGFGVRRLARHASSRAIRASVEVRRPLADVFAFCRDFSNLPLFIGDLVAVEPLTPGLTRWTAIGPLGLRTRFRVALTDVRLNELIRYCSVAPFGRGARWEVRLSRTDGGTTRVVEKLTLPLGALGRAGLALVGKFPGAEVPSNLQRLKQVLEAPARSSADPHGASPRLTRSDWRAAPRGR